MKLGTSSNLNMHIIILSFKPWFHPPEVPFSFRPSYLKSSPWGKGPNARAVLRKCAYKKLGREKKKQRREEKGTKQGCDFHEAPSCRSCWTPEHNLHSGGIVLRQRRWGYCIPIVNQALASSFPEGIGRHSCLSVKETGPSAWAQSSVASMKRLEDGCTELVKGIWSALGGAL